MLVRTNTLWNDLAEAVGPNSHILWRADLAHPAPRNEFDRLFRRGLGDGVSGHFPPVNIAENDDAYVIQARVPGLAKDDIAIELEGRKLTISGEHKRVEAEYAREERATGRFERSFTFRHALATDKIEAVVKDGILTVSLPKAEEAKPRKIEIAAK